MNKKEYLKSFLKLGQKRLPRKLKKLYLKKFYEGGPTLIWNKQQFLNLYIRPSEKIIKDSVNNLLNTPIRERNYSPNIGCNISRVECNVVHIGGSPKVTCKLTDISESKLDNMELKGYLL